MAQHERTEDIACLRRNRLVVQELPDGDFVDGELPFVIRVVGTVGDGELSAAEHAFKGEFSLPGVFLCGADRLVLKNPRQVIVEVSRLIGGVFVIRQCFHERDERLLNDIVPFQRGEVFREKILHHRPVLLHEFRPPRMIRVTAQLQQKGCRCVGNVK